MDLNRFMSDESFTLDHDLFEKIIYINLKNRTDRNKNILAKLTEMEIPYDKIIRFEAIETDLGYIGCAQSHAAVMNMVIENSWGTVLVIEDDTDFYTDPEHIKQANTFLSRLKEKNWDVALLGGNYFCVYYHEPECCLFNLMMSFCANAYIVNQHYADKMLSIFNESVYLISETGVPDESKGIDAHWCNFMKDDNWYGLYPCIAYQAKGISNIRKGYTDYEYLFNKPLSELEFHDKE
ncbi:glycosyltransferase [Morganella psychrotolerans]|uniref:Glycosyltransferase n=1 Tax=Morganella psychrotolerans TaxID=368603 RepID=A0A5M9R528_9GAMM|nr:glycosyltransferase family 25 protein [Morganella psychrotolerans]KAA8715651.1 glycosyltransferase [Morganella psychrotolerans]